MHIKSLHIIIIIIIIPNVVHVGPYIPDKRQAVCALTIMLDGQNVLNLLSITQPRAVQFRLNLVLGWRPRSRKDWNRPVMKTKV